jgi:hypothetical protein
MYRGANGVGCLVRTGLSLGRSAWASFGPTTLIPLVATWPLRRTLGGCLGQRQRGINYRRRSTPPGYRGRGDQRQRRDWVLSAGQHHNSALVHLGRNLLLRYQGLAGVLTYNDSPRACQPASHRGALEGGRGAWRSLRSILKCRWASSSVEAHQRYEATLGPRGDGGQPHRTPTLPQQNFAINTNLYLECARESTERATSQHGKAVAASPLPASPFRSAPAGRMNPKQRRCGAGETRSNLPESHTPLDRLAVHRRDNAVQLHKNTGGRPWVHASRREQTGTRDAPEPCQFHDLTESLRSQVLSGPV